MYHNTCKNRGLPTCILSLGLMQQAFSHLFIKSLSFAHYDTFTEGKKQQIFLQWYAMCKIVFHD